MKSKQFNIAILDDNKEDLMIIREKVRLHFSKLEKPCSISVFSSREDALKSCRTGRFDFLFCDVNFQEEMDGIQFVNQLKSLGKALIVIFITAFPDYLFKVYEADHVYLVMKSRLDELLPLAIVRALEVYDEKKRKNYVQVRCRGELININCDGIIYIEKQLRQMVFHTDSRVISVYGRLEDFINQKYPKLIRCHRSYIVNVDKIVRANISELIMSNQDHIPLSRTYKDDVFSRIL